MTEKDLKRIYEYMGWLEESHCRNESCPYKLNECLCPYWQDYKTLDSNSAWECVQEMERRGDSEKFYSVPLDKWTKEDPPESYEFWLFNPTNFFNCMAKWLEVKEK